MDAISNPYLYVAAVPVMEPEWVSLSLFHQITDSPSETLKTV